MKPTAPFRNSESGWFTKCLFYETCVNIEIVKRNCEPVFTLHADIPGLINFGREYINDMDPTGYATSKRLLKDYQHWLHLNKFTWFTNAKEQWDLEIDARVRSEAIASIRAIAGDVEDKGALQAAKYLADKGLSDKAKTRGRPSKLEIEAALKAETEEQKQIEKDLGRISLKVVK
jgi:hypothetical protein